MIVAKTNEEANELRENCLRLNEQLEVVSTYIGSLAENK